MYSILFVGYPCPAMNTQFQGSLLSVIQVYTTKFCVIKGAASIDIDLRFYEPVCVSIVFDFSLFTNNVFL
jgi:hypothetical protein